MRMTSKLLAIVFAFMLLAALGSWVASVLGFSVNNLLSDEGLRWLLQHGGSSLSGKPMTLGLLLCIAWGSCPHWTNRPALFRMALHLAWLWAGILLFALWPSSPLRGLGGQVFPSPFSHSLPALLCLSIVGVNACLQPSQAGQLLTRGLRRYAIYIIFALLLGFLYDEIRYILCTSITLQS